MRIVALSLIILSSQVYENDAFSIFKQQRPGGIRSKVGKRYQQFTTKRLATTLDLPTTKTTTTKTTNKSSSVAVLNEEEEEETTIIAPAPKSFLDDGFVFGLEGSGLERPKGRVASIVVEGDSLETQPYQVGIVSATFASHFLFMAASLQTVFTTAMASTGGNTSTSIIMTIVQAMACFVASWWSADLGSGILHWSVDNYGNGRTPVMGNIIAAFQGHHSAPWTITQRGFCNNVYKLCTPFGLGPIVMILATRSWMSHPLLTIFGITFSIWEIMSQEFHKWSHMPPKDCPWWVNSVLQNSGLAIKRGPHALHHTEPYDGNYCIVSGINNNWMDDTGFFRKLEHIVYNLNGVESNAWKLDAKLKERTLNGDYKKPTKNSSKK